MVKQISVSEVEMSFQKILRQELNLLITFKTDLYTVFFLNI